MSKGANPNFARVNVKMSARAKLPSGAGSTEGQVVNTDISLSTVIGVPPTLLFLVEFTDRYPTLSDHEPNPRAWFREDELVFG